MAANPLDTAEYRHQALADHDVEFPDLNESVLRKDMRANPPRAARGGNRHYASGRGGYHGGRRQRQKQYREGTVKIWNNDQSPRKNFVNTKFDEGPPKLVLEPGGGVVKDEKCTNYPPQKGPRGRYHSLDRLDTGARSCQFTSLTVPESNSHRRPRIRSHELIHEKTRVCEQLGGAHRSTCLNSKINKVLPLDESKLDQNVVLRMTGSHDKQPVVVKQRLSDEGFKLIRGIPAGGGGGELDADSRSGECNSSFAKVKAFWESAEKRCQQRSRSSSSASVVTAPPMRGHLNKEGSTTAKVGHQDHPTEETSIMPSRRRRPAHSPSRPGLTPSWRREATRDPQRRLPSRNDYGWNSRSVAKEQAPSHMLIIQRQFEPPPLMKDAEQISTTVLVSPDKNATSIGSSSAAPPEGDAFEESNGPPLHATSAEMCSLTNIREFANPRAALNEAILDSFVHIFGIPVVVAADIGLLPPIQNSGWGSGSGLSSRRHLTPHSEETVVPLRTAADIHISRHLSPPWMQPTPQVFLLRHYLSQPSYEEWLSDDLALGYRITSDTMKASSILRDCSPA